MKVEQLFTGCLAEMAYYIESNGEAAVIDPLRETEPYLRMAEADNAKIKYVFDIDSINKSTREINDSLTPMSLRY